MAEVQSVLRSHGIEANFTVVDEDPPWLTSEFSSPVRGPLEIHIRDGDLVLLGGPSLFEVYDSKCNYGEVREILEFARLLDRYLAGGEWYEYRSFLQWLRGIFSRQ
ncbi:MAG: hypothetical protein K8F56_04595 [Rhodocyclaceae bacterium]|nr:hypothetical protein [Rhodocyclaceae bacterium]